MDWMEAGMKLFFGAIIILIILMVGEYAFGTNEYLQGKVRQLSYDPEHTSVGTGIDSKGRTTTNTYHESEKWIVIVTLEDGDTIAAETEGIIWGQLKNGDVVKVRKRNGAIFGFVLGYYID
jgi:hypothetical protein